MSVYACFEFNEVDAPILKGIKTYAKAMDWRNENIDQRFIVGFKLDSDPEVIPQYEQAA